MQSTENWLPVSGYEGLYEVSDLGRVRSVDRTVACNSGTRLARGCIIVPNPQKSGHLAAMLWRNSKAKRASIHRLVAIEFVPGQAPGLEVCHNDGDPTNNAAKNLRWGSRSSNTLDAVRQGTNFSARKTHCPYGHEYTVENTYHKPAHPTWRQCRECMRVRKHNSTST